MFYYSLFAFLIFIAIVTHIILAHVAHLLLEEVVVSGYKPKHKKYLLIPGLPEVTILVLMIVLVCVVSYASIISLFKS